MWRGIVLVRCAKMRSTPVVPDQVFQAAEWVELSLV
uniref:Uncharacterized protein n=1 Tax=Arundo donax TaxID=35708 RepID=A0A0A9FWX5_ARUDO